MKKIVAVALIAVMAVCCLAGCAPTQENETQIKYTVYFGLNDADQDAQVLTVEAARLIARDIITGKGLGYKEYVTYGAYVEDGKTKGNDTLVYEFFYVDRATVDEVTALIKEKLNLASALVQESECKYDFAA